MSAPLRILLAVSSMSGNTLELAVRIRHQLTAAGHEITWVETLLEEQLDLCAMPRHDLYLLGAWTADVGRTPADMKYFVAHLLEQIGKPQEIAFFGTGETQWGQEHFCEAVDRLARFFMSDYPKLKIEQMPHGEKHRQEITCWIDAVLTHYKERQNEAVAG